MTCYQKHNKIDLRSSGDNVTLLVFYFLILFSNKIQNFFVLPPKSFLESDDYLIENTKSDFTNGWPVKWREARLECNHLFFQYSQRYTNYNLFAIEMLVVTRSHFDHISWVIYLSYEMIKIDLCLFTAFFI